MAAYRTNWKFITPSAAHQGGLWEAAVKSTKHHLRRVMGSHLLTFEEMATLLCNVEACLNSRPICATTDDAGDTTIITPGLLIIGQPIVAPPAKSLLAAPTNNVNRWKLLQKMQQQFWVDWQRDYLNQLLQRTKWKLESNNIAIGDVVLMHLDNFPPTHWPVARVVQVFPGADGLVRNVEVACRGSIYKRPIQKLSKIPIENAEPLQAADPDQPVEQHQAAEHNQRQETPPSTVVGEDQDDFPGEAYQHFF